MIFKTGSNGIGTFDSVFGPGFSQAAVYWNFDYTGNPLVATSSNFVSVDSSQSAKWKSCRSTLVTVLSNGLISKLIVLNLRFRLKVLDDGPGVDPGQLAKLTERRFRAEQARTRDPNGMGLGLHIAGQVAARHDFDLDLSAGEEGGLRVTFEGACLPRG